MTDLIEYIKILLNIISNTFKNSLSLSEDELQEISNLIDDFLAKDNGKLVKNEVFHRYLQETLGKDVIVDISKDSDVTGVLKCCLLTSDIQLLRETLSALLELDDIESKVNSTLEGGPIIQMLEAFLSKHPGFLNKSTVHSGKSVLFLSIENNLLDVMKYLLDQKRANVNTKNYAFPYETPLFLTTENESLYRELLNREADPHICNGTGLSVTTLKFLQSNAKENKQKSMSSLSRMSIGINDEEIPSKWQRFVEGHWEDVFPSEEKLLQHGYENKNTKLPFKNKRTQQNCVANCVDFYITDVEDSNKRIPLRRNTKPDLLNIQWEFQLENAPNEWHNLKDKKIDLNVQKEFKYSLEELNLKSGTLSYFRGDVTISFDFDKMTCQLTNDNFSSTVIKGTLRWIPIIRNTDNNMMESIYYDDDGGGGGGGDGDDDDDENINVEISDDIRTPLKKKNDKFRTPSSTSPSSSLITLDEECKNKNVVVDLKERLSSASPTKQVNLEEIGKHINAYSDNIEEGKQQTSSMISAAIKDDAVYVVGKGKDIEKLKSQDVEGVINSNPKVNNKKVKHDNNNSPISQEPSTNNNQQQQQQSTTDGASSSNNNNNNNNNQQLQQSTTAKIVMERCKTLSFTMPGTIIFKDFLLSSFSDIKTFICKKMKASSSSIATSSNPFNISADITFLTRDEGSIGISVLLKGVYWEGDETLMDTQLKNVKDVASDLFDSLNYLDAAFVRAQRDLRAKNKEEIQYQDLQFRNIPNDDIHCSKAMWSAFVNGLLNNYKQQEVQHQRQMTEVTQAKQRELLKEILGMVNASSFEERVNNVIEQELTCSNSKFQLKELTSAILEQIEHIFMNHQVVIGQKSSSDDSSNYNRKLFKLFCQLTDMTVDNKQQRQQLTLSHALIPMIIHRLEVFLHASQQNLPIFNEIEELAKDIKENQVISINTGTGSGKSTLLPALLYVCGFKKICVTQPRRFPCSSIFRNMERVYGGNLCGWSVAGLQPVKPQNSIQYWTDGLLKEKLWNWKKQPFDVILLDEVHERGENSDLLIALLAKSFPTGGVKVLISSATFDSNILEPFNSNPDLKVKEYNGTHVKPPFAIEENLNYVGVHPITVVLELNNKKKRGDQILVFVPTIAQVRDYVDIMKLSGITAHGLYAQQSSVDQQKLVEHGDIFFSTNIAETSLTFPQLKYVVDTGKTNFSKLDEEKDLNALKEEDSACSTLTQRKGRLGRTMEGIYVPLYAKSSIKNRESFPTSKTSVTNLVNFDFKLRCAGLDRGLQDILPYLPKPRPSNNNQNHARAILGEGCLGIIHEKDWTTSLLGRMLLKYPNVGGVRYTLACHYAFTKYDCGNDFLKLCAILMNLSNNPELMISEISSSSHLLRDKSGDLMTLLNAFNYYLNHGTSPIANYASCFQNAQYRLNQMLNKCSLDPDLKLGAFKRAATTDTWERLLKSLSLPFKENLFVGLQYFNGKKHDYVRLEWENDGKQPFKFSFNENIISSIPDRSSARVEFKQDSHKCVIVRDIFSTSSRRVKSSISCIGVVENLEWIMPQKEIVKKMKVTTNESFQLAQQNNSIKITGDEVTFSGSFKDVFEAEMKLRESLKSKVVMDLYDQSFLEQAMRKELGRYPREFHQEYLEANREKLDDVLKQSELFDRFKRLWKINRQVDVSFNLAKGVVNCEGREKDKEEVKKEIFTFLRWLVRCSVVRTDASEMPPRTYAGEKTQAILAMERRIAKVTDSNRSLVDIWENVHCSNATRETRMEVVAWVAVCLFDAKCEGGFVRDWIVSGRRNHVPITQDWFDANGKLLPEIIPADLDLHLQPSDKPFDIEHFLDQLHKFGFRVDKKDCKKEDWRYFLVFDRDRGPFTADIILPHIVQTADQVDFDVSNLFVKKDFINDLGMRVDLTGYYPSIQLEDIITNIQKKRFVQLRADTGMVGRVNKMVNVRGWTKQSTFIYVPSKGDKEAKSHLKLLDSTNDDLYKEILKDFQPIGVTVLKMEYISNTKLESIYKASKLNIENDPNERYLYHGTRNQIGAEGIQTFVFDDRYRTPGAYGYGSYFASNVAYSYRIAGGNNGNTKYIFYCKVLLGKEEHMTAEDRNRHAPSKGYNSVHGPWTIHSKIQGWDEWIVYRFGQAIPWVKITCK